MYMLQLHWCDYNHTKLASTLQHQTYDILQNLTIVVILKQ